MTRVQLAPEVLEDLDRFFDFFATFDVSTASERVQSLLDAMQVLKHSPEIGRPAGGGKRELVIGKGVDGFVALYRHVPELDTVFILALRHQREQGDPPR